jgi:hypothetical protein
LAVLHLVSYFHSCIAMHGFMSIMFPNIKFHEHLFSSSWLITRVTAKKIICGRANKHLQKPIIINLPKHNEQNYKIHTGLTSTNNIIHRDFTTQTVITKNLLGYAVENKDTIMTLHQLQLNTAKESTVTWYR